MVAVEVHCSCEDTSRAASKVASVSNAARLLNSSKSELRSLLETILIECDKVRQRLDNICNESPSEAPLLQGGQQLL